MKVLLLSGAAMLASQPVLEVVHELADQDVEVHLASWAPLSAPLRDALGTATVWGPVDVPADTPAATTFTGPADPADFTATSDTEVAVRPRRVPARVRRYEKQVRRILDRLGRAGQADRAWRRVRRDAALLAIAGSADVIIAMDSQAVLAAAKLARRFPSPDVVYGLSAGRGVILRRLGG